MFTRLPGNRKRNSVYLYIDKYSTSGGNDDLPVIPDVDQTHRAEISHLAQQNAIYKKELEERSAELEKLKILFTKATEEVKILKTAKPIDEESKKEISFLSAQIAALKSELEKLRLKYANIETAYAEAKNTVNKLTHQFVDVSKAIASNMGFFGKKASNASIEETLAELKTQLKKAVDDQRELFVQKEQCARDSVALNSELRKVIADKDAVVEDERRKLKDLEQQLYSAQSQIAKVENQFTTCSAQTQQKYLEADQLKKELESAKTAYLTYEGSCNLQLAKAAEQNTQLANQEINKAQSTISALRQDYETCSRDQSISRKELEALRKDLLTAENRYRAFEQTCKERADRATMEMRDSMNIELQKARDEITSIQKEYQTCSADAAGKLSELKTLQDKLNSYDDKYKTLETTCKNRLAEATKEAQEKILNLEMEKEALQQEIKMLKSSTVEVQTVVARQTDVLKEECAKAKVDLQPLLPYMKRQVQIFEGLSNKGGSNPMWTSFKEQNNSLYESARSLVSTISDLDNAPDDCTKIVDVYKNSSAVFQQLQYLETVLSNMFEDLSGAVRVYVRIKPLVQSGGVSTITKEGKSVRFNGNLCGKTLQTYGRFFGVIPDTFRNVDVYTGCKGSVFNPASLLITNHEEQEDKGQMCCLANDASGMCRVFNQLSDGYHVILFGYGHSGSGKTLSLLGGWNSSGDSIEPGLAQLAIANAGAQKVNLKTIYELVYDKIDIRGKNFSSGAFVQLFNRGGGSGPLKDIPKNMVRSEESAFSAFATGEGLDLSVYKTNEVSAPEMFQVKNILDDYRAQNGRILATPNNPQSSRSHLFIMLEFVFKGGRKGYLTIVDMGGRESAVDILEMYQEKPAEKGWQLTSLLMNDPRLYPAYLKPHQFAPTDPALSWLYKADEYRSNANFRRLMDTYVSGLNEISHNINTTIEVIKESMFINESINQLTLFFKQKQDATRDAKSFGIKEHRFPLDEKTNSYDPKKFLTGIPTTGTDRIGMYRILNQLAVYQSKPSKFVMICNVRQEAQPAKFCQSTKETLEFASSIRST